MPSTKNSLIDVIRRLMERYFKIEICYINKVNWHKTADDKDFNSVDIILRDRRNWTDEKKRYVKERVPVLEFGLHGHHFGWHHMLRKGDPVKVLFYQGEKAIVLAPHWSWAQYPVCRPDPYTMRYKFSQWRKPFQDFKLDFPEMPFPDGLNPTCFNWQHGPPRGRPGPGRDFYWLFDYCKQGHDRPCCCQCKNIDYPKRKNNTFLKSYGEETLSEESPPFRWEFHLRCGSCMRFEAVDGKSAEYSLGRGHIRIMNAICEFKKKGHIDWHPKGTIDMHTVHEGEEKDQATYGSKGNQVCVVGPDHYVKDENDNEVAARMINFDLGSYVEILKDGRIIIKSGFSSASILLDGLHNAVVISGTEEVQVVGSDKIKLIAPCVQTIGDNWQFLHTKIFHGDKKIHCICGDAGCSMCNPPIP